MTIPLQAILKELTLPTTTIDELYYIINNVL